MSGTEIEEDRAEERARIAAEIAGKDEALASRDKVLAGKDDEIARLRALPAEQQKQA